jgi:hypothetical protein
MIAALTSLAQLYRQKREQIGLASDLWDIAEVLINALF